MRRSVLLVFLMIFGASVLVAQTYTTVDISDPVYDFIDAMTVKGVIRRNTMVKPWPRSKVLSILEEISAERKSLTSGEQDYLGILINRLDTSIVKSFSEQGAVDIKSDLFPAKIGLQWDTQLSLGVSDSTAFSGLTFFKFYLEGDVPGPISYDVQVKAGAFKVDLDSYSPYTYTRQWDGDPYNFSGDIQYGFPSSLSGGLEIQGEITMSVWDDRFWMSFNRHRRDWGSFGSGNLFFSEQARPFTALEMTFNPWEWFSFSALTGSLEYGVSTMNADGSYPVPGSPTLPEDAPPVYARSKDAAAVEQNSYSILQLEFMPTENFYFSFFDAIVWTKRWELDYIFPLQSNFFGQEVVGDFDNVMLGGTIAVMAPGIGQMWVGLYIDEMDLASDHFFSLDRNMYAYQFGTTISVPKLSLGKINLQYSKIEPYTYTHPPVDAPTYDGNMQTYYLNNGEALGFYQPPNSDELRLDFSFRPIPVLSTAFQYRMLRHGSTSGPYRVDGSSYYDYIDYYNYGGLYPSWQQDPLYQKSFLRDGAYEWQHVIGLGTAWDGKMKMVPFRLTFEYNFVLSYFTNYLVTGNMLPYEDADYSSSINNIFSVRFTIYP